MNCEFIEQNVAEDYWCECIHCKRRLYGFMEAEKLNVLGIVCMKPAKAKIYYARPINLYNSPQDKRDIELMQKLGFEVINPNKEELQEKYKKEGMTVFLQAVNDCDALAFRSFPDLSISAGVKKEIDQAIGLNKPVIELPTVTNKRTLTVEDTREYLRCIGSR